jgi:hypothetical protein
MKKVKNKGKPGKNKGKIRPKDRTSRILAVPVTLDAGERPFLNKIERINRGDFIKS